MAITVTTSITASGSTTDASSYTTASHSPAAERLLYLAVGHGIAASAQPNTPTISGNGLTWTRIHGFWHNTNKKLNVFLAYTGSSTPPAGSLTIDFAGQTQQFCMWYCASIAGAYASGSIWRSAYDFMSSNINSPSTSHSTSLSQPHFIGDLNIASDHSVIVGPTGWERTHLGTSTADGNYLSTQYYVGDDPNLTFNFSTATTASVTQLHILAAENWREPPAPLIVPSRGAQHASRW